LPIRERQLVIERTAVAAHLGRRKEPVDRHQVLAVPLALVRQLTAEFAHRGIRETLGQFGFHQPGDRQILDAETVKSVDKSGGELMQEVPPLAADFQLDAGNFLLSLMLAIAPLFAARDGLLRRAELPLTL